jgi:hypothetical protein
LDIPSDTKQVLEKQMKNGKLWKMTTGKWKIEKNAFTHQIIYAIDFQ